MFKKWDLFDYINAFIMLIVLIVILYPMLNIISISFSDTYSILQNEVTFYPKGFNLESYKIILQDNRIPRAYANTLLYTGVGTFINVLMTAVAAYPLARKNMPGRKFFMIMIVFTMFFNGGMIPNYLLVNSLKLTNTMWALVLPNAIWTIELLIVKSFFESIDNSLHESATIDGASEYRIMFQIMLPLSKASLASIALFYFMGHWNSFFLPLIYLDDSRKYPLTIVLRDMLIYDTAKENTMPDAAKMTAASVKNATIFISMVPVMMVYPFAQKYFVKGVMLGSVKG